MKKWNKTLYKDIYKNKDKEKQIELELQKLQNEFFLKNSEISLLLQRIEILKQKLNKLRGK